MKSLIISIFFFIASQNVNAGLIDFEDTTNNGWYSQSIQSGDYRFDKNGGWMGANDYSSNLPNGADNNTRDIEMGYGSFTLTRLDGTDFDLKSLDAGLSWYNYDLTDDLTITGYLSNGGTITSNFSLTHSYQNFTLSGFLNLDSVIFSGHALNTGYVALDNLRVFSSAKVPEPMMLPLFLLGLLGLFKFTRLSPGTCT